LKFLEILKKGVTANFRNPFFILTRFCSTLNYYLFACPRRSGQSHQNFMALIRAPKVFDARQVGLLG
jgi:hypothetical protein